MALRATPAPRVRSAALARAGAVMAVVLIADLVTKHFARGIGLGESRSVFFGIHLVHVRNTGVAFNFFSGGGTLVLVFTLLALAVLLAYFLLRPAKPLLWLP